MGGDAELRMRNVECGIMGDKESFDLGFRIADFGLRVKYGKTVRVKLLRRLFALHDFHFQVRLTIYFRDREKPPKKYRKGGVRNAESGMRKVE